MSLGHIADITIAIVLLVSIVVGLFRGFVKEALSLCTWGLAVWLGVIFHDTMSLELTGYIQNETIRSFAAFGLVFVMVLILGGLLTYGIGLLVKSSGISGTDRVLGLVFGMTRGVFLITMVLTVLSYTSFSHSHWWHDSVVVTKFEPLIAWVNHTVPDKLNFLKDNLMMDKTGKNKLFSELVETPISLDALAELNLFEEDE